jgi:hypothetical protein
MRKDDADDSFTFRSDLYSVVKDRLKGILNRVMEQHKSDKGEEEEE